MATVRFIYPRMFNLWLSISLLSEIGVSLYGYFCNLLWLISFFGRSWLTIKWIGRKFFFAGFQEEERVTEQRAAGRLICPCSEGSSTTSFFRVWLIVTTVLDLQVPRRAPGNPTTKETIQSTGSTLSQPDRPRSKNEDMADNEKDRYRL